ncbi:hypothetical protein M378DRAFT_27649 [Amanita muscaria Koide BX008]|uniref:R3H domain-containing protein n=1 Tax=Amanita muscaria (strain Koide BX008) TaxID=946122 RepID=A0A0C2SVX2_AMAMK|nr:hypothetical protein M378DRAFT_27649 [Amanita muscaria Koide BX008]
MDAEQPPAGQSTQRSSHGSASSRPSRGGGRRHREQHPQRQQQEISELTPGEQPHGDDRDHSRRNRGRWRGRGRGGVPHATPPPSGTTSQPNRHGRAGQESPAHPSRAGTPDQPPVNPESSSRPSHSNQPRSGGYRGSTASKFNPTLTTSDTKPPASADGASASAHIRDGDSPSERAHTEHQGRARNSDHRRRRPRPDSNTTSALLSDDLTSTLIKSLSTRPYPDCSICFSPIHPAQPTWSCSPAIPQVTSDGDATRPQYCWNTFHLKCIRSWAEKSVKELEEAWRNRGEMDKRGEWRCPGCQARREIVPTGYSCFCNATPDPKPGRLATPHSCGNSCSRPRESGCGHPCPILCHPGPCPPCQVTTQLPCPCPRGKVVTFRCGDEFSAGKGKGKGVISTREGQRSTTVVSCGSVCGRSLDCGTHSCEKICHPDPCNPCEAKEEVTCYCGKAKKKVRCGEGHGVFSSIRVTEGKDAGSCFDWMGRFECEQTCDRLFDCGIHRCQNVCHRQLMDASPCPFSPSKITHCPCGKHPIGSPTYPRFPARKRCTDPIPTCESTCDKVHDLCGHSCTVKCHVGSCPPCSVPMIRPCRCGMTTREIKCSDLLSKDSNGEKEILCDRPCAVLRACGKHECRRLCCPLSSLAFGKGKKGRAAVVDPTAAAGIGEEEGGLHECDLVCGKMLSCGNHTCEKRDHKGPCPSCLRSSFEEAICPCGRTIIEPPIPCGTKVHCSYQCPRIPPCGHPPISHSCHEEPATCPPCVYLTTKLCACGKKEIVNVKCSLEREKVSCATTCGRLLSCGFHRCQRLCHAGDCGACTTPCGKDRKLCLPSHHPCTRACHAPSACPEDDPCQAVITLTCSCGRLTQAARCGRNIVSSSSTNASDPASRPLLKCITQCEVAKRNARLAEALGITAESRERATKGMAGPVVYPDEVVAFAKEDPKFVLLVEKTFAEFVASNKRSQVLPHMPIEKRKFVHSMASVYRFDAQTVDQEPVRSVQIMRRVDTRVPDPLLSAHVATVAPPAPNFGKLGLSTGLKGSGKPGSTGQPVPGMTASGPRGWGPSARTTPIGGASTGTGPTTPASVPRASLPPSRSATPQAVRAGNAGSVNSATLDVPNNWEDDA